MACRAGRWHHGRRAPASHSTVTHLVTRPSRALAPSSAVHQASIKQLSACRMPAAFPGPIHHPSSFKASGTTGSRQGLDILSAVWRRDAYIIYLPPIRSQRVPETLFVQSKMLVCRSGIPCLTAQPDACVLGTSTRCTCCRRPRMRSKSWCITASKDGRDDDRGVNWDAAWSEFKSTAKKGAPPQSFSLSPSAWCQRTERVCWMRRYPRD